MRKIAIIGAGGSVGPHLMKKFGSRAVGTYRKPTPEGLFFDLLTQRIGDVIVEPNKFSHAIILASMTNLNEVVANPEKAHSINIEATWNLVKDLITLGITPVFTSSDGVLGVGNGPFKENAAIDPKIKLGTLKHEIEKRFFGLSEEWLILRLSKVYSLGFNDGNLIAKLCHNIIEGGSIPIAKDLIYSPIFSEDLATAIESAIDHKLTGLYHLGGPEPVTYLDVANYLIVNLGEKRTQNVKLEPRGINELSTLEVRPTDISMDSDKIMAALNLQFQTVEKSCRLFVDTHFK
jgi:dTDP-4-dehydrorhamnose reductase